MTVKKAKNQFLVKIALDQGDQTVQESHEMEVQIHKNLILVTSERKPQDMAMDGVSEVLVEIP